MVKMFYIVASLISRRGNKFVYSSKIQTHTYPCSAWDLQNLSVAQNANICPGLTRKATKSVHFRVIYTGRGGCIECSRRN